ncbi:hypothetical protein NC653_030798 [Populus alba x Populus x berolinensis]|uniref:Uncharacterized protein n=1 Tax=Populus alba x Populus x berolinensis TaxID=444605 RepID=A0AAD6LXC8_9ROSI|nr:hypothetical protein NC653_030798 [Populus alba x Populus x berolinensis]
MGITTSQLAGVFLESVIWKADIYSLWAVILSVKQLVLAPGPKAPKSSKIANNMEERTCIVICGDGWVERVYAVKKPSCVCLLFIQGRQMMEQDFEGLTIANNM